MAKAVMVQEPENTLLTAPFKPKDEREVFIITKISKTLNVGGVQTQISQGDDGIIGFMVAFDNYEKALTWAGGDASLVMTGKRS